MTWILVSHGPLNRTPLPGLPIAFCLQASANSLSNTPGASIDYAWRPKASWSWRL